MGTNCAPLLADLFLYSYEADFIQKLLNQKKKKLAVSFNLTFRYIEDFYKFIMTISYICYCDISQWTLKIKDTT